MQFEPRGLAPGLAPDSPTLHCME